MLPSVSLGTRVITSRIQRFVCVSEKSVSFSDMMIVEFNKKLFIPIPALLLPYHLNPKIAHDGVREMILKNESHEC